MTYTSKPNSSSLRFLLLGGWTAIKSATVGSLFAVFLTLALSAIFEVWQNGIQAIEFSGSELQDLVSAIAFLWLFAILLSTFPAFIGGVFLSWLVKRHYSNSQTASRGKPWLGALIGASAGVILTLLVLIPADVIGRTAHSGIGYNLTSVVPGYILVAVEIISIATIVGGWTDNQLRKLLVDFEKGKTG